MTLFTEFRCSNNGNINKNGKFATLFIPQNKISQIKKKQTVSFNLTQISSSSFSFTGEIINISDSLFIENNFAFYNAKVDLQEQKILFYKKI